MNAIVERSERDEAPASAAVGLSGVEDAAPGVFQRSFAIIEFVVRQGAPVAPMAVAEHLGLPKPSVYRMIKSLVQQGLLRRPVNSKRFVAGPRLTDLAFDILRGSVQHAPRRMVLESVVHDVGETCNIGALETSEIVYLDRVEAQHWPLRLQFGIGSRVPLHCTAIGKLFLALLPVAQREALMRNLDLRAYTPATIVTRDRLADELAAIQRDGLSIDREEYLLGVVCAACPVLDRKGELRAGVAIQAPAARLPVAEADRHHDRLRRAAEQLRASFDHD